MPPEVSPQRGEIWRVNFDPTIGDEIQKTRPCIVLNQRGAGRLALRLVVPLTGWQEPLTNYPWCMRVLAVEETVLTKTSAADVFQMRSVSLQRFRNQIGVLSIEDMERIVQVVAFAIGYSTSSIE